MTLLENLKLQLGRFDDEAFAILANKGLLRRAYKVGAHRCAELMEGLLDARELRVDKLLGRIDLLRCIQSRQGRCLEAGTDRAAKQE